MWCAVLAVASAVIEVPKVTDPVPLVVVMHGDREHAAAAAARWHAAVHARGWALLAPECPTSEGCKDSWWRWNGDPQWLAAQIDGVAKQHAIDRSRVYVIGWSGGASYLGFRAPAWHERFAAIVLHGGGMAPSEGTPCPNGSLPAYFLVGDKNPLHALARDLRGYFAACKQEVVWDVVSGADHAREEAALTPKKANAILDWLAEHKR